MSYSAIVFKIKTEPHPNPEVHSLRIAKAFGYELVIGRDNLGHFPQDGDLFVFFPTEGQLSEAMCEANDLYPKYDDNGLRIGGGFFDPKNRRVRAQKFKGVKSEGFALPIERLSFTGFNVNKLKESDEFTELNGIHLCNKYQTQAERRALAKLANKSKQGKKKYDNELFKKHVDTLHWKKIKPSMLPDQFVYVLTEKLHGTSARSGHIKYKRKPQWMERIWRRQRLQNYLPKPVQRMLTEEGLETLLGTRTRLVDLSNPTGYYGDERFRTAIHNSFAFKLLPNETVYYEIVGWVNDTTPIMPPHNVQDKELKKLYGNKIHYNYGCEVGQSKAYVYRITYTLEDGTQVDLDWTAVKQRAKELGLETVPELEVGIYSNNWLLFEQLVLGHVDGPSTLDGSHIREGVCVRIENGLKPTILKNKSFDFGVLEGYIKENDNYVDLEEIS